MAVTSSPARRAPVTAATDASCPRTTRPASDRIRHLVLRPRLGHHPYDPAEVLQTAAAIVLSYDLAPEGCHGDYQGVFGAGYAALSCVSPALLGLILAHPRPGWYLLAAAVGAAGAPVPLIVGRAARSADARTSEGRPSP